MKNTLTAFGRAMSLKTADWIAQSEQRFKDEGRYATNLELAEARSFLADANARRAQRGQLNLGISNGR